MILSLANFIKYILKRINILLEYNYMANSNPYLFSNLNHMRNY